MIKIVSFALLALLSLGLVRDARAQEPKPAVDGKPAAPAVKDAAPAVKETPKETVGVAPTASPTQVAAAIAEALRSAEAARAKRQAASRPAAQPRPTAAPPVKRRYEVRWPSERVVVKWPSTKSDHVHVTWPDQAADEATTEIVEP